MKRRKPTHSKNKGPRGNLASAVLEGSFARNALDDLEIGVAHLSQDGNVIYANSRFTELLGFRPGHEVKGTRLRDVVSAASWLSLHAALEKAVTERQEGQLRIEDGVRVRFLRIYLAALQQKSGDATLRATVYETNDPVEARSLAQEHQVTLHSLTGRILQAQDEERRSIARDLHDVTGQDLAAINMSLSALARRAETENAALGKDISGCVDLLRKVEDGLRTMSYVLHPPLIDELGLAKALEWYLDGFSRRSGIQAELDVQGSVPRLPIEREIAMFRIVQEGLTNVIRHSRSATVRIRLFTREDSVLLEVEDHGKGMDAHRLRAVNASVSAGGVGIPGMKERLKQFGGSLEVHSGPGGTQLIGRIPIAAGPVEPFEPAANGHGQLRAPTGAGSNSRKQILVADDHEVVRRGIRTLLEKHPDLEICAEARDGLEAIRITKELQPDLVILDLTMPGVGGLTAAHEIRRAGIPCKMLVFTNHLYPGLEQLIRTAGCQGLVQKSTAADDLLNGVRAVLGGGEFYTMGKMQAQGV